MFSFTRNLRLLTTGLIVANSVACSAQDVVDVDKFQPPIVSQVVHQSRQYVVDGARYLGLSSFTANVPSYNNKGNLISSWNPRVGRVGERPTFIVTHGGSGIGPTNLHDARWLIKTFDANVLVLDSFWSRGRSENWITWREFGANMRLMDAIAAARYVRAQGADPAKTYLIGGSQGGWTVLRTFTASHQMSSEVQQLYRGGIALYPNCTSVDNWYDWRPSSAQSSDGVPPLGPYSKPVIIFTGSADTATSVKECKTDKTLKSAYAWHHYEGATHAWDIVHNVRTPDDAHPDGVCSTTDNKYVPFRMCRDNRYTTHMRGEIKAFVEKFSPGVLASGNVNVDANIQTAPASRPAVKYGNGMSEDQVEALLREMSEQK